MNDLLTQERTAHETKVPIPPQAADQALSEDTISDLFHNRDQVRDQKPSVDRDQKISARRSQENAPAPKEELNSPALPAKEETQKSTEGPKQEDASLDLQRLQQELEKTQKRLTENQQYGRQNAQRLKTALKVVKELETEGSLNEEEAARLIESLERESDEGLGMEVSHPFGKVLAIANQELENIRKYTDDATLDDKVRAFDFPWVGYIPSSLDGIALAG